MESFKKKGSCEVDLLSSLCRIYDKTYPMLDFSLENISEIKNHLECDFTISRAGEFHRHVYKVKRKFEQNINIVIKSDASSSAVFRDFELIFENFELEHMCSKTTSCQYTSSDLRNLRRHEATCSDQQTTVSTQVAYGEDKTTVKELVEMGYLPKKALRYRKSFFLSYDIECLEDLDIGEGLKNVIAVHKIVSVAASTNRGHSKCFIRDDSSHESGLRMIEKFLDFLEEVNVEYNDEIPEYFFRAVSKLEEMTSDESTIMKSEKMKLTKLCNNLKKYTLMDCYGFNSGNILICIIIFFLFFCQIRLF